MAFIETLLQRPTYGWKDENGNLIIPSRKQMWSETFSRMNIFKTKKNWISLISGLMIACLLPFLSFFLFKYFSWWLIAAIVVYSMVIMGTHGTIWLHRYCTHKSLNSVIPCGVLLHKTL